MPRKPQHALIWSHTLSSYELFVSGHLKQRFTPSDETAWLAWLTTERSFAFQSMEGSLNVYKEARSHGEAYWYAYHTTAQRTHKRYLGRTTNLTFERLEEVARTLNAQPSVPPPLVPARSAEERGTLWKVHPHEVMPAMALLSTQLAHPLLPSPLVLRERLLTRLDAALSHRLTLLSASAGWGKTTLLSTWAARSPFPLAWLSLDGLDNEPTRFWVSVLAALRTCLPGVGETTLAMLCSPQPPLPTAVVLALLQELDSITQPIILLLDDYHLIEDQEIHASLLFFLEYLPESLHLVLASRVDPPLALARWRVRGQLLELRDADLRFHEKEATHFFAQVLERSLLPEDVKHLTQRTEGWIAGLQLAALSLQQREDSSAFVRSFTGSHRHVLDYVQEEILARLPVALQHFLPQIAILNKISAPLCQAITGDKESLIWLAQAEQANLFLVPLDEERHWYRMHDLFRGALMAHFRATQPELVALLHQRATHFYEERGEWHEAIFHALEASDFWAAARLMEQAMEELWLYGESQRFYQWVMVLPEAVLRAHARFALTAALYLLNSIASTEPDRITRTWTQVEQMIERVESTLSKDRTEPEVALLRQRVLLLRLWHGVMDITDILPEKFRRIAEKTQQLNLPDDMVWQSIPLSSQFLWRWNFVGEGTSLLPLFKGAWERAREAGNRFAMLKTQQWLGGAYLRAGRLRLAYDLFQSALDQLARRRGYALLGGYLSIWRITVLLEWNRLDEAREAVRQVIHHAQIGRQLDLQCGGYFSWLLIELAAGDVPAAQQVLQQLTDFVQHTGWGQQSLSFAQVTYWLEAGDLFLASQWAADAKRFPQTSPIVDDSRQHLFLLASVSLALQHYRSTLDLLEQYREQWDQIEDGMTLARFLALSVVALHQLGEHAQTHATLTRLLVLTEPEGSLRVYLDRGDLMQEVLQDYLTTPTTSDHSSASLRTFVVQLLTAFAHEAERLGRKAKEQSGRPQSQEAAPSTLLEPLTPQEQRVLRLLAAGRSNQEIARLLVISLNTVKTHVKNLYGKLHVSSRAQAGALARTLHLL